MSHEMRLSNASFATWNQRSRVAEEDQGELTAQEALLAATFRIYRGVTFIASLMGLFVLLR